MRLGEVRVDYHLEDSGKYHIRVPEEVEELNGEFTVELEHPKRGGWLFLVLGEAAATAEETRDFEINLGKSRSRSPSHVWILAADGSVFGEKQGEGQAQFLGAPVSAVVLRHQHSNYGYTHTEEWEVHYLPPSGLTEAQQAKIREIASALRHEYFRGFGTDWEISRIGVVRYQTPYERTIYEGTGQYEALKAMHEAFPVDVALYRRRNHKVEQGSYQDPDHPMIRWIEVGPELL